MGSSIPNGHLLQNSASKDDWVEEWMCQLGTLGNYEWSFWVIAIDCECAVIINMMNKI